MVVQVGHDIVEGVLAVGDDLGFRTGLADGFGSVGVGDGDHQGAGLGVEHRTAEVRAEGVAKLRFRGAGVVLLLEQPDGFALRQADVALHRLQLFGGCVRRFGVGRSSGGGTHDQGRGQSGATQRSDEGGSGDTGGYSHMPCSLSGGEQGIGDARNGFPGGCPDGTGLVGPLSPASIRRADEWFGTLGEANGNRQTRYTQRIPDTRHIGSGGRTGTTGPVPAGCRFDDAFYRPVTTNR